MDNEAVVPSQEHVNNYLVPAILTTLCCCVPFGIVSIIFASQVNTKLSAGDVAGAKDSAAKAKLWMFIGLGVGLVGWIGYLFFSVVLPLILATLGECA